MFEIRKTNYEELAKLYEINFKYNKNHEYYLIMKNNQIGYFVAYDNLFHISNKYIYNYYFNSEYSFKEVFKIIKKYFDRPLQIMSCSNDEQLIKEIEGVGFELKRKSYEIILNENNCKNISNLNNVVLINSNNPLYEEVLKQAYNYYKTTHETINPLSVSLVDFSKILPKEVYLEIKDNGVLNYTFKEENELCYMGSNEIESFEDFIKIVCFKMFEKHQDIFVEVDNTDIVAMMILNIFKININTSYNTYILK